MEILIYTDGACRFNPGPGGWSAILVAGLSRIGDRALEKPIVYQREISGFGGGNTTNNIMELTAILEGLKAVKNRKSNIKIFTDSQYAIGVLSKGWVAKKNKQLIVDIKKLLSDFPNINFEYVKGHDNNELNEKCDVLANDALNSCKGINFYSYKERV